MVGTFDVENYGDLLFPLIAQKELTDRLGEVELLPFSYQAKTAAEWPFQTFSITELPRLAPTLDALLMGGGFLVRFDKGVAPGYLPPSAALHHPTAFWLTPALICLQSGVPVLWNAPGAHYGDIPAWAAPFLELVFSQSAYIAMRDEPSREALAPYRGSNAIDIVPDTVFGLCRLLPEGPSFELNRLREANGLCGPYIIIQGVRGLDDCLEFLQEHAGRLSGYRFLALAIGPINGDDDARAETALPGIVRLPVWPSPLLLAELIRGAAAVIGPSFHLAITALAAGVPVFTPARLDSGKYPGLAEFEGLYPLPTDDDDVDAFASRLGKSPRSPKVDEAIERLKAHWDRIAQLVRGGRTDATAGLARFWQSLPGLVEGHAQRADAAVAALQSRTESIAERKRERATASDRIAELRRLVALARSEIATRDYRIKQLLTSTSWRVTAGMRAVGRRLGR
jgi:lipopolysaccharide transport system ATP-binding protein